MGKKNRNNNFKKNQKNKQEESDIEDFGEDNQLDLDEIMEKERLALHQHMNKKQKTKKQRHNKQDNQDEDNYDENSDLLAEEEINNGSSINNKSENILHYKNDVNSEKKDSNEEEEDEDEEEEDEEEEIPVRIYENDKAALTELKNKIESKFNEKFKPHELFLERMTVTSDNIIDKKMNINDDIKRELVFYNLSFEGAVKGINKLKQNNQKLNRPEDFMAEMLKSDEQMIKIKKEILSHEMRIKKFQLREEKMLNKKFNKKTKTKGNKESQEYMKTSKEAINHWKKSKSALLISLIFLLLLSYLSNRH